LDLHEISLFCIDLWHPCRIWILFDLKCTWSWSSYWLQFVRTFWISHWYQNHGFLDLDL